MKINQFVIIFVLIFVFICSISFVSAISTNNTIIGYAQFGKESRLYERLWAVPNIVGSFDDFGSIVVEDDILYFSTKNGSTTSYLIAMNASDGSIIWRTKMGGQSDGTPLLDNQGDYVYINTYIATNSIGYMEKYYKSNGTQICNTSGFATLQSMDQSDTLIFDGSYNGTFTAYNKDDCSVNWSYSMGGTSQQIPSTPLYLKHDDSVVFNTKLGVPRVPVVKLNATTGEEIWVATEYGGSSWYGWDNKPSFEDDILYMPFGNGPGVIAYYYNNGTEKWVNNAVGGMYTVSTIDNDSMYVGGTNDVVYKLNKTTGASICSASGFGDIYNGLIVTNNNIGIFGSLAKTLIAFNTTNCVELWRVYLNGAVYDMTTLAKGNLYVKSDDRSVYAFKLGSGTTEYSMLGFDTNGTNYCKDCLTTESYATILCNGSNQYENITCNITNLMPDYDSINNFSLQMPYVGWLYYSNGTKINDVSSTNITFSYELNYNDTLELTFERGYYNVSNCAELQAMVLTNNYRLTNDINCSGVLWNTIGAYNSNCLLGIIDGQNHVIYNLRRTFVECIINGTIRNLGFVDCNVSYCSLRCGVATNIVQRATIENVFVKGAPSCKSTNKCGGLVGDVQYGSNINNSYVLLWNYTFGSSTNQGGLSGVDASSNYSFSAGFLRSGITNSLYDSNKTNVSYGAGTPKTTEELTILATYAAIDGWNMSTDMSGYWHIDEGRYPCFAWNTVDDKCPDFPPSIPLTLGLSKSEYSTDESIISIANGSYDLDLDYFEYYYMFYNVNTSSIIQNWSTNNSYEVQPSEEGHTITVSAMPVSTINGSILSSNVTISSKQCSIISNYTYTNAGDIDCISEGVNVSAVLTLINTTIFTDYVSIGSGGKIVLDTNSRLIIS